MLFVFLLIGAAISLGICLAAGYAGPAFAGFFLLLTAAAFLAILLAYVLFLWVLLLFVDRNKIETENHPFYRFLLVQSIGLILFFCGVRVQTEGVELVPDGTFLLVGNHRSGYDPMIAIWALRKHRLNFVSKPSNFNIPIGGPMMVKNGFLAIDRDDDRKALRTILAVADRMQRGVASFGIYPEGTRSHTDEMLPFRNGCFKAAQRAKVPIVVASTHNSAQITKRGPLRPTKVLFRVCGVIDAATVATKKTNELSDDIRCMLEASLAQ